MKLKDFSPFAPRGIAFVILLFILSRLFIWVYRPMEFTEIFYSYMPFAHLWASGTTPYLEQWYEYPPLTIPLFYLPHVIDMATRYWPVHLDYLHAYRLQLLLLDTGIFALIWTVLNKLKVKPLSLFISLVYYILITAKAHHFIYDTMDITFAASLAAAVGFPIVFQGSKGQLLSWVSYFAGIALKLLNGPLGLVYAAMERKDWKKTVLIIGAAFLLVWGVPLFLYRSSLQVILVYHQIRGLQVDTAAAVVVRTIDEFVHSEKIIEVYKNYEVTGPLSSTALSIVDIIFPLSVIGFTLWATWKVLTSKKESYPVLRILLTLGYILILMITSKVLSRPFLLWHIPLLAMLPFSSVRRQLTMLSFSFITVLVTMSSIPEWIPLPLQISALIVGIIRTVCFVYLLYFWWKETSTFLKANQTKKIEWL